MRRRAAWSACGVAVAIAAARLVLAIVDPESSAPVTDSRVPDGELELAVEDGLVPEPRGTLALRGKAEPTTVYAPVTVPGRRTRRKEREWQL